MHIFIWILIISTIIIFTIFTYKYTKSESYWPLTEYAYTYYDDKNESDKSPTTTTPIQTGSQINPTFTLTPNGNYKMNMYRRILGQDWEQIGTIPAGGTSYQDIKKPPSPPPKQLYSCINNNCKIDTSGGGDSLDICKSKCKPIENHINITGKSPYDGLVCFDEDGTWAQHSGDDLDQYLYKLTPSIKQSKVIEYLVNNNITTGKNYIVGIISASGSSYNINIDGVHGVAHGDFLMITQMNNMNKVTNNAIGTKIINGIQYNNVDNVSMYYGSNTTQKTGPGFLMSYSKITDIDELTSGNIGGKKCNVMVQNIDMLEQNGINVNKTGILVDNDSKVCDAFDSQAAKWKKYGYNLYSVNLGSIDNSSESRPRVPVQDRGEKCILNSANIKQAIPYNSSNPPP